jgi:methylglutaconyl-CoA hydratase
MTLLNKAGVTVTIDDSGVATVTLTAPEKHNAFDEQMVEVLTEAFTLLGDYPGARCMILAAEGKHFSAGADLHWMKRMAAYSAEDNYRDARQLAAMLHALYSLAIPTIARVQGAAYGGAIGLISCCDIAVGSENASFCLSEVKIGLIPATISPYVVETIGARAARRYFQTAEQFDAKTAQHLGLLHEVVSQEQLDTTIAGLTKSLLNNSPQAVRAAKKLIEEIKGQPINDVLLDKTSALIADIRVSPEGQAGLQAFLNKCKAPWIK